MFFEYGARKKERGEISLAPNFLVVPSSFAVWEVTLHFGFPAREALPRVIVFAVCHCLSFRCGVSP
jgi:hypothetical protein